MRVTRIIESVYRKYLPSPFTIAVLLTFLTLILAWIFTGPGPEGHYFLTLLSFWEQGIWNSGMIVFAYQMMLILVLGHVLVLSRPAGNLILRLTRLVRSPASAALLVALPTMLVSFFNWGLGLIFGAILARKVGEYAHNQGISINYPLVGAAGYTGLMVWHGGISGSALIKVSEPGHVRNLMTQSAEPDTLARLPDQISTSLTVFSAPNLIIFFTVVALISLLAYYLGKWRGSEMESLTASIVPSPNDQAVADAGRLDGSRLLAALFGTLLLLAFFVQYSPMLRRLNITPDMLNFFMLGLAILLHGRIRFFTRSVERAIGDTAGILIQFPLYFGIMGIMSQSGMIQNISDFFVSVSNTTTLPVFTFISAGLVNVFVPSGGGQWAIQGPMVLESALELGVPLSKAVLALAYGDQITNMVQPFWALPLLGITKLKAREILPYSLLFMIVGTAVYLTGLLIM